MLNKELLKRWTYQVFAPGTLLRVRYEAFRELLALDETCLERITELEDIHYGRRAVDWTRVVHLVHELEDIGRKLVSALTTLSPAKGVLLMEYFQKIAFYLELAVDIAPPDAAPPFVAPLDAAALMPAAGSAPAAPLGQSLGGKAANLLQAKQLPDLPVPPGFVVTASAFHYFLEANNLREELDERLRGLRLDDPEGLEAASAAMQALVRQAELPAAVLEELLAARTRLPDPKARLAVRSSAVAEDAANSFAGQYDSILDVAPEDLPEAWRTVVMGKYSPRALIYRILTGLSDMETPMAVLVMPMVDAAYAGVCYTRDADRSASLCGMMALYAVPGLGENLVSGRLSPGVFCIDPGAPPAHPPAILQRPAGFAGLPDETIRRLARMAWQLEQYFGSPQDVEWAVDRQGAPWILQTRPMQQGQTEAPLPRPLAEQLPEPLLSGGVSVSPGGASGPVVHARTEAAIRSAPPGCILITESMPPSLVQIMSQVAGVISLRGSRASHFASVAREFGLPVIVGGEHVFDRLPEGEPVTLDAVHGHVFPGLVQAVVEAAGLPRKSLVDAAQARLEKLMPHVATLNLTDPQSPQFKPESCRSVHDVVRFAHESAVQEMFSLVGKSARGMARAKKLHTRLPMTMYVLDLGDGLFAGARDKTEILPDDITSTPMWALWWGMSSAPIPAASLPMADWEALDRHSGGLLLDEKLLASFAVIDDAYAHLMLRFGYHFCVVDALCVQGGEKNHVAVRFKGGGGQYHQRLLRLEFLRHVLEAQGFSIQIMGDLFEGRLAGLDCNTLRRRLVVLGRLLAMTRLMDVALESSEQARTLAEEFLAAVDQEQGD
ncbi:PEP/pyruvate-binding domain-containing protein [Megalodesulfovibrio paquesii]